MTAPRVATAADYREFQRTGKWPSEPSTRLAVNQAIEASKDKRHKYNVGPRHLRQLDGYTFDSIAERKRYEVLRVQEKAGLITELRVHPCWPLVVNNWPIGEYEGDFSYRVVMDNGLPAIELTVEDVKGVRTAVYRMKKALMKALHDIEVTEVDPVTSEPLTAPAAIQAKGANGE